MVVPCRGPETRKQCLEGASGPQLYSGTKSRDGSQTNFVSCMLFYFLFFLNFKKLP